MGVKTIQRILFVDRKEKEEEEGRLQVLIRQI
jgi:hypothetical protein